MRSECANCLGLFLVGVPSGACPPSHEQILLLRQMPEKAPAPVSNSFAIPKGDEIVEASSQATTARGLADIYYASTLNPILANEFRNAGGIFLLESPARALLQELRQTV